MLKTLGIRTSHHRRIKLYRGGIKIGVLITIISFLLVENLPTPLFLGLIIFSAVLIGGSGGMWFCDDSPECAGQKLAVRINFEQYDMIIHTTIPTVKGVWAVFKKEHFVNADWEDLMVTINFEPATIFDRIRHGDYIHFAM